MGISHFINRRRALDFNPNNTDENMEAILSLSYPRDRDALIEIATKHRHNDARLAAAKKLPLGV